MNKLINSALCALALCSLTLASAQEEKSKPKVNVGLLMHTYLQMEQNGFGVNATDLEDIENPESFSYGANLYRARLLFDAKLTDKDYIFVETELSASIGLGGDKAASIKILDAQYDRIFSNALRLSAGKMLVSYNRNGLQTAGTLMANDFGYFQYAYNMSQDDPLQNDNGRDIGVNLSGLVNEKFGYRFGVFSGCRDFSPYGYTGTASAPLRMVGRLHYNFLDADQLSGTNLGSGSTFTLGAGFDTQASYYAVGADAYIDTPMGAAGSITANIAYSYMNGGNIDSSFNFTNAIPDQNIVFAELGYYIKRIKLQPWVKYELQNTLDISVADQTVLGGGVNYFFNGYGSNVKLSYVTRQYSNVEKFYGQVWLQFQLFIF